MLSISYLYIWSNTSMAEFGQIQWMFTKYMYKLKFRKIIMKSVNQAGSKRAMSNESTICKDSQLKP